MTRETNRLWTPGYILLGLSILALSVTFYLLMPTLPVYAREELGIDNSQIGYVIAIYTLAALLIRPFSGLALDLTGRKRILLISAWLFALLFLGYHLAGIFAWLLVVRFLHGLAWGVSSSAYFTAVVDIIPLSKRGRGIGYFGLAFNLAMAVGPATGLLIMGQDRYAALFIAGLLLAAAGAGLLFWVPFPEFERPSGLRFSWRGLIASRALPVSFNTLLISSAFGGLIAFLALYALDQGLDGFTGLYFTLMAAGMGIARLVSGTVFDRMGPLIITIAGLIAATIGYWLLGSAPVCSCFLISSVVIGLGIGIVIPVFQTMANNVVVKSRRGVANSTFLTGLDLGIGVGSMLTGWISQMWSLDVAFKALAGILAVALVFFLMKTMPHYGRHIQSE